jgi:hypothetical protein
MKGKWRLLQALVVRFTPSLIIVERDPDKGMARFVLERSV